MATGYWLAVAKCKLSKGDLLRYRGNAIQEWEHLVIITNCDKTAMLYFEGSGKGNYKGVLHSS